MASEPTSSPTNEPSQQLVISGKIAKSRRSKNSSKYSSKHKERKRSPATPYSDSDSQVDDATRKCAPSPPRTSRKTAERSGYSSSNETSSDCQSVDMRHADEKPTAVEETELRRRHATIVVAAVAAEAEPKMRPDTSTTGEWEMVDKSSEDGDDAGHTTTDESSDDFWKCEPTAKSPIAKAKQTQKRGRAFSAAGGRWQILETAGREWTAFKDAHRDETDRLRRLRNRCAVGFLLIFIFCGIGGVIFHSVEGAFEMFYKCGVKRVKRDFLDTLWSKSRYLREDEWKSLARSKLMEFENQLYDAYEAGMTSYSGQKGWSFLNSFVYCLTVVTTIGYGHIAPATALGRLITIVYSLFGIPLFLILLADYGKLFTRVIKFFWAYVRRLYYTGSCRKVRKTAPVQEVVKGVQLVFDMTKMRKTSANNRDMESSYACPTSPTETPALSTYTIDDEFNLPISVAVAILLLYMLSGALLFMKLEHWSLFESFYFVYISVSTIGFGDLVPSSKISVLLISLVYFVFGLSLTSMCINVITEKLTDSFRQATAKIGATMGVEITDNNDVNIVTLQKNTDENTSQ